VKKAFLLRSCAMFAVPLAASAIFATTAQAQQITTEITGQVNNEAGAPLTNATVIITDTRTGASITTTANAQGLFTARNLSSGGPYTVTATAPNYQGQTVADVNTSLQGATQLTFSLSAVSAEASADTIVVTGQRANVQLRAIGPGTAFGTESLEAFPSISRDIRDIIRIDPRVSLDRANEVDRISCLGGNDRANTFTVDGIVQADVFGLNGTPFASRNSLPLPYDAIRETSVEFAPFDVEYSDFTGCAINVVTKSGGNRFHGSAFYTYRDENLRGDRIDGEDFTAAPFKEKRWGATISGPIFRDRLFFFAGYEQTDLGDSLDSGPTGGGFPNEENFVTQAQFDEFSSILSSVYGQDTGGFPRSTPESSTRYFGRLDLQITDGQRLEGTYQRLEETNVETDVGAQQLAGLNSFEDEGTISNYYSARLFSQWTDNLSTEIRVSRAEVGDVQGPVGGGEAQSANPIPRIAVGVVGPSRNGLLVSGPGIFRSANQLDTKVDQAKFKISYDTGNHDLTFGAEINKLNVFNLFAINATGTLFFRNLNDLRNGILAGGTSSSPFASANDVVAGRAGGAVISATPSGDINEAAAEFDRSIYSLYAQDQWRATDQLSVLAGLRVQWFDGDAPRENPTFEARYGFSNSNAFSKLDPLLLPRLALTYELKNEGFFRSTQIRGGVGVFSGGDPVVYFSNAFSNNGFSTGEGSTRASGCSSLPRNANGQIVVVANGQFTGFPQCAVAAGSAQAAAGLADTQSTDPNFEAPTVTRANLGVATQFGTGDGGFFDNWRLTADYIYSRFHNPINFVDLAQAVNPALGVNGFTVDGRPIYRAIETTRAGCDAVLQGTGGTPPIYTNVTAACFGTNRDDEIQLTNGPGYESHVASAILSKSFPGFTSGGNTRFSLGYAFTDAENNRFNGSSTATSSYDIVNAFDRQNPAVATSEFQTRHNISLALNFRERFFGDYDTSFGFVSIARSGRPYSLTFDGGGVFNDSVSGTDNALLYIPTGSNDPNVSPSSNPAAVAALVDYAGSLNCARESLGRSIRRNTCRNDWFYDLDLRFRQELPGPGRLLGLNDRIEVYADFDNFLNLLDSSWNVSRSRGLTVPVVEGNVDPQGRYIITNFNPQDQEFVSTSSSVWRIQVGVRYEF